MVQLALPHSWLGAMTALLFRFVMYDGMRALHGIMSVIFKRLRKLASR